MNEPAEQLACILPGTVGVSACFSEKDECLPNLRKNVSFTVGKVTVSGFWLLFWKRFSCFFSAGLSFFSPRHFGHFLLRHFGHLSHSYIKTHCKSVH